MLFWELIRHNIKSLKFKIFIITFFAHVLPIVCLFLFSKMHDYKPLNLAGQKIIFAPAKFTFNRSNKQLSKSSGKIYNKSKSIIKPVIKNISKNLKNNQVISKSIVNKSNLAVPALKSIDKGRQANGEKTSVEKKTNLEKIKINSVMQEFISEQEPAGGILGIDLGLEIDEQENDTLLPWELILKDGLTLKFYQMKIMDDIVENREPFFVTIRVNNIGEATIAKQSGCKIPVIRAAITKALLEFKYPKELYGKTKEFKV